MVQIILQPIRETLATYLPGISSNNGQGPYNLPIFHASMNAAQPVSKPSNLWLYITSLAKTSKPKARRRELPIMRRRKGNAFLTTHQFLANHHAAVQAAQGPNPVVTLPPPPAAAPLVPMQMPVPTPPIASPALVANHLAILTLRRRTRNGVRFSRRSDLSAVPSKSFRSYTSLKRRRSALDKVGKKNKHVIKLGARK